jgi:hypothetical protein
MDYRDYCSSNAVQHGTITVIGCPNPRVSEVIFCY